MNRDRYEEAWTKLLAARRNGTVADVRRCAHHLHLAARELARSQGEPDLGHCSHFMVANGHCINCHEQVGTKLN